MTFLLSPEGPIKDSDQRSLSAEARSSISLLIPLIARKLKTGIKTNKTICQANAWLVTLSKDLPS